MQLRGTASPALRCHYSERLRQRVYSAVQPVDHGAVSLHSAKPGLLALGEVVDGAVQLLEHVVRGELPLEVAGREAVFEAIELQGLPWNAGSVQPGHLFEETMPESLLEPGGDTFSETGPFPAHPEHKRVDLRDGLRRVALFVDSDFDGPDQTFPVQEVGGVVEAGGGPPQS